VSRIEESLAVKVTVDNPSNNRRRICYLGLDKGERADTDPHDIEPGVEESKVTRDRCAEDDTGKMKLANGIVYSVHGAERATVTPGSQTTRVILNSMKNLRIIIDNNIKAIKSGGRVLKDNNTSSKTATDSRRNSRERLILISHQRLIRTISQPAKRAKITSPSAA
jgi:hypothetical protein